MSWSRLNNISPSRIVELACINTHIVIEVKISILVLPRPALVCQHDLNKGIESVLMFADMVQHSHISF